MEVVVGLSLKNLKPRVWDRNSPYYIEAVRAVMVSYAEFDLMRARRRKAMEVGLHDYLGVPDSVRVYLDNGSFALARKGQDISPEDYAEFVAAAKPDWYPPPRDYIPAPAMNPWKQAACVRKTMAENLAERKNGIVPVIHVGRNLRRYIREVLADEWLARKPKVAIGGIVPNLLRAPKALPYRDVLDGVHAARQTFEGKEIHLFGVGGTSTLHLAVLLGMNSVDSSGWRNRAARGIVQLPGRGDRLVTQLGSWRGREPSQEEWSTLRACTCPACRQYGVEGLKEKRIDGFCKRATHNLWTLLREAEQIEWHLGQGLEVYEAWYGGHVENSVYEPLIEYALELHRQQG